MNANECHQIERNILKNNFFKNFLSMRYPSSIPLEKDKLVNTSQAVLVWTIDI
jgi:hypothetical protein